MSKANKPFSKWSIYRLIRLWKYQPKLRKNVRAALLRIVGTPLSGKIAYICSYPGVHSAEQRIKIMKYLAKKYDIDMKHAEEQPENVDVILHTSGGVCFVRNGVGTMENYEDGAVQLNAENQPRLVT